MRDAIRIDVAQVGYSRRSSLPSFIAFMTGERSGGRLYFEGLTFDGLQRTLRSNFTMNGPIKYGQFDTFTLRQKPGVKIDGDHTGIFDDLPSIDARTTEGAWIKFTAEISRRIANSC